MSESTTLIAPATAARKTAVNSGRTFSNGNETLASCDPDAETPPVVLEWQNKLETARVDRPAYETAQAKELRSVVCATDDNAISIFRGTIRSGRLIATGHEVFALVDFIMSEKCPVSTSLTNDDKAYLMKFKKV